MLNKIYSTKINVAANFIGSFWNALLGVLFVPIYLRYVGIESYGLIGVFNSIQVFILLLDFGLSPTFNRELARLSALGNQGQEIHNLKRTLEIPNWIFAVLILLFLIISSPFLARYWLQPEELSLNTVSAALSIMSVSVAIQFSTSFYVGGLLGLQKQLLLNIINTICGTLRSVGALVVLAFVSPTIEAFLLWQTVVAVLQFILIVAALNKSLPSALHKPKFNKDVLRNIWRYAAGMTGITIVSLILMQTDKVILSRMLDLKKFGYYTLAVTISNMAIMTTVSAINNATYPKFSGYVSVNDETSLRNFYHRSSQIMSVILIPVTVILALYSYETLFVWTGSEEIAQNTHLVLSLLAVGTGLNGLMWIPYHLQLAYGWTKLPFYINIAAICILVPLIIFGTYKYGAVGAAAAWITLNALYILVTIQIMHRRLLKEEKLKWYFEDLLIPACVALSTASLCKMFITFDLNRYKTFFVLAAISVLTLALTTLSTKASRDIILKSKTKLLNFKQSSQQI